MIRFIAVTTTLGLFLAISPAAAQFDRTDLADGTWGSTSQINVTGPPSYYRANGAGLEVDNTALGENFLYAGGIHIGQTAGVGAASNTGSASFIAVLYEPEKVQRKNDRASLQQKHGVAAALSLAAAGSIVTNFSMSMMLEECSLKASGKGTNPTPDNQLQIKLKCPDLVGPNGFNLNANQLAALTRILGVSEFSDKTLSLSYKDADFTPAP